MILTNYFQILHTSPKLLKRGRGRPPSKKPLPKAETAEEDSDEEEEGNEEISQDEDEGKSFHLTL